MTDWKDFFSRHREYIVKTKFYECENEFTLEELYQAFKARLLDDLLQAASYRGDDELASTVERAMETDSAGTARE